MKRSEQAQALWAGLRIFAVVMGCVGIIGYGAARSLYDEGQISDAGMWGFGLVIALSLLLAITSVGIRFWSGHDRRESAMRER